MCSLDGPRLKIVRAKAEIDRLSLMENAFGKSTKYHVVKAEFNPKSGKDVYRVRVDGPPPTLEWGIYIGEIAHNLRSALDQLVYQLALLNTPCETVAGSRDLQFPIFLRRNSFDKSKRKKMIGLLLPKHQDRIEELQPYKRGSSTRFKTVGPSLRGSRNSPLFWLQEINNADKHRLIQVVDGSIGIILVRDRGDSSLKRSFTLSRLWSLHQTPHLVILKDGAKFGEADPEMCVDANISPVIVFAHSCDAVATMGVCYVLEEIATRVSQIIESFSPEF
jgi:hypothetical protein